MDRFDPEHLPPPRRAQTGNAQLHTPPMLLTKPRRRPPAALVMVTPYVVNAAVFVVTVLSIVHVTSS